MPDKGQLKESRLPKTNDAIASGDDFVLDKDIFSNIFDKDIRRVFIYKKAERLAKAIHLITPAFSSSVSLRNRLDAIAVGLVDAAILPPIRTKEAFSRELLALSSVLAIARSGGLLSPMNANLISNEAHILLGEIAAYEEPRLFFDDSPTLAGLAKSVPRLPTATKQGLSTARAHKERVEIDKGHISDTRQGQKRTDTILSVIKDKGTVYIKDISMIMRDVSEKTVQRELKRLVEDGVLIKQGSRRWTAYALAS